jgi:SLOG cluster3 family
MDAIFLSASVPDPERHPRYHMTSDVTAIRDAIRALATVVLPSARLVWGGHPAITPLIRVMVEGMGIMSSDRVRLFQSSYFRGKMPEDNAAFERVIKVPAVRGDRTASLERMRRQMIGSEQFIAGVFIGGMEGVEDEYRMFRAEHPSARALPVASTGAAALILYEQERGSLPKDLLVDMAYPTMFRRLLGPPFEPFGRP